VANFNTTEEKSKSGQGVFLPAGLKELCVMSDSDGMEIIISYPFKL